MLINEATPLLAQQPVSTPRWRCSAATLRTTTAILTSTLLVLAERLPLPQITASTAWWYGFPIANTLLGLYCGYPYLKPFILNFKALRRCQWPTMDMNTLVSLTSLAILIQGPLAAWQVINNAEMHYLTLFVTYSALLVCRALKAKLSAVIASDIESIYDLVKRLLPEEAVSAESRNKVKRNSIKQGDKLFVARGQLFPVDGHCQQVARIVDNEIMHGELTAREVPAQGWVHAGARNVGDDVVIIAATDGNSSYLAHYLSEAYTTHDAYQRSSRHTVSTIIDFFVPVVVLASVITFISWSIVTNPNQAFVRALAVLIAACPCTLGIANTLPFTIGRWWSWQHGVLMLRESSIDQLAKANVFLFDKTGTLTELTVKELEIMNGADKNHVRQLITYLQKYRLQQRQADVYANTILKSPLIQPTKKDANINLRCISSDDTGMTFQHGDTTYRMGSSAYLDLSSPVASNDTTVWLQQNTTLIAKLSFQHTLRSDAESVVATLRRMGKEVAILTGDDAAPSERIATHLDIPVTAQCSPTDKATAIKNYQQHKKKVCFIGDGINDIPAVKAADISCVVAKHSASSSEADVVIPNLTALIQLFPASRAIRQTHTLGVVAACCYAVTMTALSAAVLPLLHEPMDPTIAGVAMAVSSLLEMLWAASLIPRLQHIWRIPKSGYAGKSQWFSAADETELSAVNPDVQNSLQNI